MIGESGTSTASSWKPTVSTVGTYDGQRVTDFFLALPKSLSDAEKVSICIAYVKSWSKDA